MKKVPLRVVKAASAPLPAWSSTYHQSAGPYACAAWWATTSMISAIRRLSR